MTVAMKIYLQTRGLVTDYGFLGRAPDERWWLVYREFTSYERPTILVSSEGSTWRVYASGLTSSRRDRVTTPIRYTMVLEGGPGEGEDLATGLIAAWMADTLEKPGTMRAALDQQFPEAIVERLMNDVSTEAYEEVKRRVRKALESLPAHDALQNADRLPWVGAMQDSVARRAFLEHVAALLRGTQGAALMVNLVGTPDEAMPIRDQHPGADKLAILIDDPQRKLGSDLVPLPKKKASNQAPPSDRTTRRTTPQRGSRMLIPAAIVLGVAAWLLVKGCDRGRRSSADPRSQDRSSRVIAMISSWS